MSTPPDPATLAALLVDELVPSDWMAVDAPAGIDGRWRREDGAVLTLFPPASQTVDELLAADTVALLANGDFRADDPLRDGQCLRGRLTDGAPAGPAWLDATAVATPAGARRVVLQRPITAER